MPLLSLEYLFLRLFKFCNIFKQCVFSLSLFDIWEDRICKEPCPCWISSTSQRNSLRSFLSFQAILLMDDENSLFVILYPYFILNMKGQWFSCVSNYCSSLADPTALSRIRWSPTPWQLPGFNINEYCFLPLQLGIFSGKPFFTYQCLLHSQNSKRNVDFDPFHSSLSFLLIFATHLKLNTRVLIFTSFECLYYISFLVRVTSFLNHWWTLRSLPSRIREPYNSC